MTLRTVSRSTLATDSWRRLITEWARADRTWLIVPKDPVKSGETTHFSYRELYTRSLKVAQALLALGGSEGDRVVVALDNGPKFCFGFFGALFAGMVPVPFPPPHAVASGDVYRQRLKRVVLHCAARFVLTEDEAVLRVSQDAYLAWRVSTVEALLLSAGSKELPAPPPLSELAMIQYTSDSPRGVELSHGNLLRNAHGLLSATGGLESGDVTCSWMPMYHELGLVGSMLASIYAGVSLVMLTPRTFIRQPESWLWAMSRYRAVASAAPDFAYRLCSTQIQEANLRGLDLGAWRVALNSSASEHATSEAFQRRFGAHGFRSEALMAAYGLAETAGCCVARREGGPAFEAISREQLDTHGRATPSQVSEEGLVQFAASVGAPIAGQRVRIADAQDRELSDRSVGEIQIAGPCVMRGYHLDPDATRRALAEDGFLRTGERGYIADGSLYVLGRTTGARERAGNLCDALEAGPAERAVPALQGSSPRA